VLQQLLVLRRNSESKTPDPVRASASGAPAALLQEAKERFQCRSSSAALY